jgi:alpha-1,3-mannosyl-glycoprotein beta-1,2-N-acetylglucosaminyltransferase
MRTDVMPGLGWMLPARVSSELIWNWPNAYWDDFMREPDVRKGRQCVFPEVSRTTTFGKDGTSRGENFKHLSSMRLNDVPVNWTQQVMVGRAGGGGAAWAPRGT